jgi:hypothetical protein
MTTQRSPHSPFRPLRRLLVGVVVVFVGLGLTTTHGPAGRAPAPPPTRSTYSHEVLQVDAAMTQQMSVPNADTERQNHRADPQLLRSSDANYLSSLEQHQADIDRMLARP